MRNILLTIVLICITYQLQAQSAVFGSNKWDRRILYFGGGETFNAEPILKHTFVFGFLHHKYNCHKARINQYYLRYITGEDYSEYGFKLGHNFFSPAFNTIAVAPNIGLMGSRFTTSVDDGFKLTPEIGLTFILKRRQTPYIDLDIMYGYNWITGTSDFASLARHELRVVLGMGIMFR